MKKGRKICTAVASVAAVLAVNYVTIGAAETVESMTEKAAVEAVTEDTTDAAEKATAEETAEAVVADETVYEAENADFSGNVHIESQLSGYSGDGYAAGFQDDGDSCSFTISAPEDGFYDLHFISAAQGGYKENYVNVDGENLGTVSVFDDSFTDSVLARAYLSAGEHEVSISKFWGWICLDKLIVQESESLDESIYQVSASLCNPNASESARRLMSYLADNYGKNIISGQYSSSGQYGKEFTVIKRETEKEPAILGLDFIEYSPSRVANGSTPRSTEYAINFWENGGIVTFCWHWNPPEKYLTKEWYRGFYADSTDIDLAAIMNGEDEEGYQLLMEDIDAIAKQLQILQEADVPILWRPLHEASGGWFWWGASGADAYKKLYILLYDKLTNEYGLNNLIWVWNGQDADWYPGDEYVDIIGEDLYPGEHVYTPQTDKYLQAIHYTDARKMVVMSENGCIFDPELAVRDGSMWGFFCTWEGEFVAKNTGIFAYSEQYTEIPMLQKAYDSDVVITLDELPDLRSYPIRE